MTLFLQKAQAAGESGLIQYQDFAYPGNGNGLELGDSGKDGKLGGTQAGRFEAEVIQASDGAGGTAKIEGGTGTGAGEVEGSGISALDLHIQVKYN